MRDGRNERPVKPVKGTPVNSAGVVLLSSRMPRLESPAHVNVG